MLRYLAPDLSALRSRNDVLPMPRGPLIMTPRFAIFRSVAQGLTGDFSELNSRAWMSAAESRIPYSSIMNRYYHRTVIASIGSVIEPMSDRTCLVSGFTMDGIRPLPTRLLVLLRKYRRQGLGAFSQGGFLGDAQRRKLVGGIAGPAEEIRVAGR